jgi:hypothetical protein
MICAYIHPYCSKLLNAIEEMPKVKQYIVRIAVLALCAAAFAVYYVHIYSLPKLEYNQVGLTSQSCSCSRPQ